MLITFTRIPITNLLRMLQRILITNLLQMLQMNTRMISNIRSHSLLVTNVGIRYW